MDEATWVELMSFLISISSEIAPNAYDLVTPPGSVPAAAGGPLGGDNRAASAAGASSSSASSEIAPATSQGRQGSGGSGTAAAAPARVYTLREGVGARRLAKFRSQAAVQLLLVQGCSELYARQQVGCMHARHVRCNADP